MRTVSPIAALVALLAAPSPGLAAINIGDTCAGFFACTQTCPEDDDPCFESCAPSTTPEVGEIQAVLACLEGNCPSQEGDELNACLDQHCRPELDTCFADATGTGLPCDEGLSFSGRCDDNVLEWCQQEQLNRLDCTQRGSLCAFVPELQSFDCVSTSTDDESDPHLLGLAGLAACSAGGRAGVAPLLGVAFVLLGLRGRRRSHPRR